MGPVAVEDEGAGLGVARAATSMALESSGAADAGSCLEARAVACPRERRTPVRPRRQR
eukprot:CAMPEP_0203813020 /NCGR_PEP_ID=MMETSP0115-20131106/4484_1 /ASSEMBLY_ACC=CAM_ASM_000227 /TAXON_ID=33651 /ORGANISM="Bicosoecid sp, Strain ms1" /LENGTH=57 /DNA_ID=CAMNT_0050721877 /DNA_START=53 /DNA_END=223 /DNA_ORIENTATION=-